MVSRKSYGAAFAKFGQDPTKVTWISDEQKVGWKWNKPIPSIGGRKIPWLPDFLKIVFARNIFRSNSSFSLFASWISDTDNIYSPLLHEYTPGEVNDYNFVKGNHPHWMEPIKSAPTLRTIFGVSWFQGSTRIQDPAGSSYKHKSLVVNETNWTTRTREVDANEK